MTNKKRLSIVVPVYNASVNLIQLTEEVEKHLSGTYELELLFVNDCSLDDTAIIAEKIASQKPFVKNILLSVNLGEYAAVMCGLKNASGDIAVVMDDDLQNPPSEILKLLHELEKGYDAVYAKYKKKQHGFFRNVASRINNITAAIMMGKPLWLYQSSFKVISGKMLNVVKGGKVRSVYIDRIIYRTTKKISSVEVEHHPSARGYSTYNFRKLVKLYICMYLNLPPVTGKL